MTLREFYLERRKSELPVFLRVLNALPKDQLKYKPAEPSPSAEKLIWTLTGEITPCLAAVREGKAEWKSLPIPSFDEMLAIFERSWNELTEAVSKMDDAAWEKTAQFYSGGKMVSEQAVGSFLWFIHFDAIHHRGQLSTYIRPMGGKVPAIYGPSADDRGR